MSIPDFPFKHEYQSGFSSTTTSNHIAPTKVRSWQKELEDRFALIFGREIGRFVTEQEFLGKIRTAQTNL